MENSRDNYLDNAKFFLILLVVLGHSMEILSGHYIQVLYRLIYLFHIPAFVLIAGYFLKFQKKQKFSEMITQYLIFQTIYCGFNIYILKNDASFSYSTPYWILWFSLALIFWKLVTPLFIKLKYPVVIAVIIAVLIGYDDSVGYYFCLSRTIVFFPFFLLGYYAEKRHFDKLKSFFNPIFSLIIFSFSFLLLLKLPSFHIGLLYNSSSYKAMGFSSLYAGIFRLLFLAWGGILVLAFFVIIPNSKQVYSKLGQRTFQAYILHGFIIKLLAYYQLSSYITSYFYKALFFIGIILITIILLLKPWQYIFYPIKYLSKLIFAEKSI